MPSSERDADLEMPFYDGFPYWTTRIAYGIYHITLLPPVPPALLVEATTRQALINRLPTCLVLAEDCGLFVDPDGHAHVSDEPPRGGILFAGRLAPGLVGDPASQDFRLRKLRLVTLLEWLDQDGMIFGDLTKGGHDATPDELQRLAGRQPDGTPQGLQRCGRCGDWAGTCLDPSELFGGQVMTVHCLCQNHNRCARCGRRLSERRLNANYYNARDGQVWHVPGFDAFEHRCSR